MPCALPQRHSARAAALTSVSKPTGTPSALRMGPTMSVWAQPGLGVDVMCP
jgi:hypothetical protein